MQVSGMMPELSDGVKAPAKPKSAARSKMGKVMGEFARKALHSGSKKGPKVTSRKQAVAIGMSEARDAAGGGYSGFALSRMPKAINNPRNLGDRRSMSRLRAAASRPPSFED